MTTTTTSPTIVCPPWCTVDKARHIAELPNWEGGYVHDGRIIKVAGDCKVYLTSITLGDGSPDVAFGPGPEIMLGDEAFTFTEAQLYARAILELVREARA